MKKILFVSLLILFSLSCKKEEKGLIRKGDFSVLSAKVLLVHHTNLKDEQKWLVTKSLLEEYGITSAEYIKTKDYFAQDPYFWEDVYQQMNTFLEKASPDTVLYLLRSR